MLSLASPCTCVGGNEFPRYHFIGIKAKESKKQKSDFKMHLQSPINANAFIASAKVQLQSYCIIIGAQHGRSAVAHFYICVHAIVCMYFRIFKYGLDDFETKVALFAQVCLDLSNLSIVHLYVCHYIFCAFAICCIMYNFLVHCLFVVC